MDESYKVWIMTKLKKLLRLIWEIISTTLIILILAVVLVFWLVGMPIILMEVFP